MVANILLTSCIYKCCNSFLAPHINKKSEKKRESTKKKYWKKIYIYIYQWEEYIRTSNKFLKTGWGRSKHKRLKNLTVYPYWQKKFNLQRKIQN
jgi:hypothetical protein